MRIVWSLPVRGRRLGDSRGDLVRARYLIEALRLDGHDVVVVEDAARAGSTATVFFFRNVVRRTLPSRLALTLRDLGRCVQGRLHGARVAAVARERGSQLIVETQVAFAASGAIAAERTGLPLVLDDCSPSSEETVLGVGLSSLARRALRRQMRAATRVVVVSGAMHQLLLAEGASREKLRLVPNGIEAGAFGRSSRERVRRQLGFETECVMGFVGSFQPWHQVELLLESAARLRSERHIRVLLVGNGPGLLPAVDRARRLALSDCVTSLGEIPSSQVPEIVSAFDVGVVPGTNAYGNPMKLMEYAAAGLASVAPDVPPVREVVDDGVTGLLFAPGDLEGLTVALEKLAKDVSLRARLGGAARRRVLSHCSWRDRARDLLSDLEMLAQTAKATGRTSARRWLSGR